MRHFVTIVVTSMATCAICDESAEFARALNAGADAKMTLRIVNTDGVPIPDAEVEFGFWNNYSQGGFKNSILRSDTNGECVVSGRCNGSCVWNVTKPGYYRSHAEWSLSNTQSAPKVVDGKWQPYGETREIVLKQIVSPVDLPCLEYTLIKCPVFDEWLGFDLGCYSWVKPYRRRFDYSVHFRALTFVQREKIWKNNIKKLDMGDVLPDSSVTALAERYETSAGGITMVLENVKRLNPDSEHAAELIERLMRPHCELMQSAIQDGKGRPAKDYTLEGLNIKGDIGLDKIVEAVRNFRRESERGLGSGQVDRPRMNLLLWGPPGTGKSEYVKYLGDILKTKVVVKMGSDLLDKYVGGTEARIASAFAEAEAEKAILFLDEIDGLLQSRNKADHSWEVTQVNELLHQMENFNGVMIGATNFFENLDQAVLRRFTFKLEFGYLDGDGKRLFFERMFQTKLNAEESVRLEAITCLSPGDFRTVRQSLYYLGSTVNNAMRLGELEKESRVKIGSSRPTIGF